MKSSVYSGAENVIISIIKHLHTQLDFVYVSSDGPIRQILEREGIPNRLLSSFNRRTVQEVIREYDHDIVHAHDFSASVLCASMKGRFRLLSHLHYDPPWVRSWNVKSLAYTLCYKKIDLQLVVSDRLQRDAVFAEIYSGRMRNIGNPIDGEYIRKMTAKISDEVPKMCDILFIGRLEEQKDPQRFIQLIYRLKMRGWNSIHAVMLGDGRLKAEYETLVAKRKLGNNIRIEGFRDNPYPFIASARMLCVTSRWEGFGLVAAEASILGTPVVTTATSGSIEMFGENAPEICHTDEDFIGKIEWLHTDEDELKSWRLRSDVRGKSLDNVIAYMESMAEIYTEVSSAFTR